MNKPKVELHLIIDSDGIDYIQLVGSAESHDEGQSLYYKLIDVIQAFDKNIQKKLNECNAESDSVQLTTYLTEN